MISRKRHVMKTVTWRVVATTTTVVIAGLVTGDWGVGFSVGGIEFFVKILLYYTHERFWYNYIGWGVREAQAE